MAGAGGSAPCQNWANWEGFVTLPCVSKKDGRRGTFEEDLQRCISHGRRNTRDVLIRDVRKSGSWFPEKVCILEHPIFRFAKILRDRCSTARVWPGITFSWQAQHFSGKFTKRIGTRPAALHSTFHFWRKSRRIASFLTLSGWTIVEIAQICFVFDVANLKNWGSLAA